MTIEQTIKALTEIPSSALSMPLSRRCGYPEVVALKRHILGDGYHLMASCAKKGLSSSEMSHELSQHEDTYQKIFDVLKTHVSLVSTYIPIKHLASKAPTLTVSPALEALLADTGIRGDVPARFFAPPFANCFIEFNPADLRHTSTHHTFAEGRGSILEGVFVQETRMDRLPSVSRETREVLELDPNSPTRFIELGFSESPINNPIAAKTRMPAALDTLDVMTIYIQDEEEPIGDILERHIALNQMRQNISPLFGEHLRQNFMHLTKIFFYLSVEKKMRKQVAEQSDLEKRLESVADKKKGKLARQLTRVYDRIVIGPEKYTPLKELVQTGEKAKGTKAPHYRRGYFGIRWKGTGQAKTPELVRVSHSIINANLLNGKIIEPKDYEIR